MTVEQRLGLRYMFELGAAMILYAIILFARRPLMELSPNEAWHSLVLLAPAFPLWLAFWAVVRHYQRLDEYQRVVLLQVIAVCAGIAACVTASYSFAKDAFHLPDLSIEYAWPILGVCWGFATGVVQIRNRLRMA